MPVTTPSKSVLFIEYSFLFVSSRPEVPRTEVERSVFQSESLADPSTPLGMTGETLGMTDETLGMTGETLGMTGETLGMTGETLGMTQ